MYSTQSKSRNANELSVVESEKDQWKDLCLNVFEGQVKTNMDELGLQDRDDFNLQQSSPYVAVVDFVFCGYSMINLVSKRVIS